MKFEKKMSNSEIAESESLRYDCQNLLRSLKRNQNIVEKAVNNLNMSIDSEDNQKILNNKPKTVSFSNYLRSSSFDHEQKIRARSASPLNQKFRSILKNGSKKEDLFEIENEDETPADSANTSRSQSISNIYAQFGIEDDFNEKISNLIKYTDLKADTKTLNKKSLIDYISRKRQTYLSHKYDQDVFINKNKVVKVKTRSKSADPVRPKQITKNTKKINKQTKKDYKKVAKQAKKNKPLLGLAWALDSIENKKSNLVFDKSDEYWQELSQFRNENKQECISSKACNFNGTMTSFIEMGSSFYQANSAENEDDEINHKCIHSYTLNERLFPVPIYKDANGNSLCPVCKSSKKQSDIFSPQFCKISIPKSKIINPILIEPNLNSNSADTLSLSEHCSVAYQNGFKKNSKFSKSKNVDLKSSTTNKEMDNKITMENLRNIALNKDPATSTIYNKAHAMRYDLEDQHQKRLRELIPKFNNL